MSSLVRIGTSSFSEKDWVGPFYPEGIQPAQFLSYYSGQFSTVEIDATYYAIPAKHAVDSWRLKSPDGFLIAAKFPKSIVHAGDKGRPDPARLLTREATYGDRDKFLETISRLGPHLGSLVLQFPFFQREMFPSPAAFLERLEGFLRDLPQGFSFAVEIRNKGWIRSDLADLCRRHNVALVLVDQAWMPAAWEVAKSFDPITTDFTYIRLLGDRKEIEAITTNWDREVIDREARLEQWADFLVSMVRRPVRTLIYVNNHYAGHAPATARRLDEMFHARLSAAGLEN